MFLNNKKKLLAFGALGFLSTMIFSINGMYEDRAYGHRGNGLPFVTGNPRVDKIVSRIESKQEKKANKVGTKFILPISNESAAKTFNRTFNDLNTIDDFQSIKEARLKGSLLHFCARKNLIAELSQVINFLRNASIYQDISEFLNLQDKNGETALHVAARNNNLEIVQALLDVDVDLEIKNSAGQSALDLTTNNEIKALLISKDNFFSESESESDSDNSDDEDNEDDEESLETKTDSEKQIPVLTVKSSWKKWILISVGTITVSGVIAYLLKDKIKSLRTRK